MAAGKNAGVQDLLSESRVQDVVETAVLLIEAAAGGIIALGAFLAFWRFAAVVARERRGAGFAAIRLDLGRFLALGLEFLLAADVLRTAVAPSWDTIGQLAAVATIRTALNWFLRQEIRDERQELAEDVKRRHAEHERLDPVVEQEARAELGDLLDEAEDQADRAEERADRAEERREDAAAEGEDGR